MAAWRDGEEDQALGSIRAGQEAELRDLDADVVVLTEPGTCASERLRRCHILSSASRIHIPSPASTRPSVVFG